MNPPVDPLYNLAEFMRAQEPLQTLYAPGWTHESDIESSILFPSGGGVEHQYPRQEISFMIESRSDSAAACRARSWVWYVLLFNRFHLPLPEVTVGGVVYPEVLAAQISPVQVPGYLGTDAERRHLYSFNVTMTIGDNYE